MRILISNDGPTAHYYIRMGFARALAASGHEVKFWDIGVKNTFDAFDEFSPDIFVGQSYNLNRDVLACLKRRPNCKITLKAGDWGYFYLNEENQRFPILFASNEEILNVQKLLETNTISFIDMHYHPRSIGKTHGFWKEKLGIKVVGLMSAADVFDYTGGKYQESFKSDLAFVGGRWGYKSQTLTPWLIKFIEKYPELNIKIFGNQSWGIPQYCGFLDTAYVKDVLASATICPNISEPHSQAFGFDIIERPFKLLSNKCFVISDYVEDLKYILPEEIVYAHTPEEFHELCIHYLNYPEERQPIIDRGYKAVIDNHTYFHRAEQFFNELDLPQEAVKVMETYSKIKEKLGL